MSPEAAAPAVSLCLASSNLETATTRTERHEVVGSAGVADAANSFWVATGWETPRARRCECGAAECDAVIYMKWDEQDRADHVPRRWTIAPGHIPRGGARWRVVEETDRFVIVEIDEQEPSPT